MGLSPFFIACLLLLSFLAHVSAVMLVRLLILLGNTVTAINGGDMNLKERKEVKWEGLKGEREVGNDIIIL